MLQLIRFLKGYLIIKVMGSSPERFMNLCSNHHIFLWDIKNYGDYYTMKIDLKEFYEIKSFSRKTGSKVVVTGRFGLPFLSVKMKRRIIFFIGIAGSFVFWMVMSLFVWTINIEGNYYITDDVFCDFLEQNGIHHGMRKKELNIEQLEKEIRNSFELVTWTSAKLDGSTLMIQIKENELQTEPKKEEENSSGTDLVASADGKVVSLITRAGVPLVKEGMEVKKGDVLVQGAVPIMAEDGSVRRYEFCEADADVFLECEKNIREELPAFYLYKDYTGRERSRNFVIFGERKINLGFYTKRFAEYDEVEEKKQMTLFGNNRIPIYYGKETRREYQGRIMNYSKEQVKEIFGNKIIKIMQTLEEKGVQIIEKNVTMKKSEKKWILQIQFLVVEQNGISRETSIQQVEQTVPADGVEQ